VTWITNVSPNSGTAGATIAYTVQANTGATRIGHITVTGGGGSAVQLTVTQAPLECAYTLAPNTSTVPSAGGSFNTVLAQTGACSTWTASSDVSWITNVSPSSGTAGTTIAYTVQANTGVARIGHITVTGGRGSPVQLTVTQVVECTYTLAPNTNTVAAAGGSFNTVLTRGATCTGTWVASSSVPWITNISPSTGTASATIAYVVQANDGVTRSGTLTVQGPGASATLTVTQAFGNFLVFGLSPRVQPTLTDPQQGAPRISQRRADSLTITDASRFAPFTISSRWTDHRADHVMGTSETH
jgi:hypothetical protein